MLSVLRERQDLIEEVGETSSGSDKAPSEDNLELEEIEKIVPIEDPKLLESIHKLRKARQTADNATSYSP